MLQILDSCSDVFTIPTQLTSLIHTVINIIKIAVPIMLIIWGMLDLGKAVIAQKEDEIKKGQQTFVKRIIAAVLVFFVVFIVQLVVDIASGAAAEGDSTWKCVNQIINGE